ncbi:MAG TPA: heme ABC exporter ATP-binding protein CcmA [Stellaceae bacterium]|nr:heme ABC exporter ATP-binding protein CcmA [Stellaceae bacterium]
MAAAPDLVAENLACRRGDRLIFTGLSCRLAAGGALLVTGANGSGKSSLLRVLATLLAPVAGRLLWDGAPVPEALPRYRAAIHYLGHLDALKPALTPRETLAFWTAQRGLGADKVEAALATFGLEAIAEWPCRWLSAGQRRRVALARLIAAPAPLWLLDEPTASLDRDGEERLTVALAAHRAGGGCAVITTHAPIAADAAATLPIDDFAPEISDVADAWTETV